MTSGVWEGTEPGPNAFLRVRETTKICNISVFPTIAFPRTFDSTNGTVQYGYTARSGLPQLRKAYSPAEPPVLSVDRFLGSALEGGNYQFQESYNKNKSDVLRVSAFILV